MLYVDVRNAGISGDMLIAALIDLGAEEERIESTLAAMEEVIGSCEYTVGRVRRGGIEAASYQLSFTDMELKCSQARHAIELAPLSQRARSYALSCLESLVKAEAKVHGVPVERLRLHEAPDTIADFAVSAALLDSLGLLEEKVLASPVNTGAGFHSYHGQRSTLPAPATAEILTGKPVLGDVEFELTTPTGAALLVNFAEDFTSQLPLMRITKVGYGAGSRELGFPNVLRLMLGEDLERLMVGEDVTVLETTVDSTTGEELGYLFEKLFEEGALDISIIPCVMKKNRPGQLVRVLCRGAEAEKVLTHLIQETGTLGVKVERGAHRYVLNRRSVERSVKVLGKEFKVRYKQALNSEGKVLFEKPEFEDARAIARELGLSLREAMRLLEGGGSGEA